MSTADQSTGLGSTLLMFLIAALFVGGAVAGFVLGGIGGMTMWFVGMTFLILALMVLVSVP